MQHKKLWTEVLKFAELFDHYKITFFEKIFVRSTYFFDQILFCDVEL